MTLEKLNDILELYGSDERLWPAEHREQCLRLIAEDTTARSLLTQYQTLEQQLDQVPVPEFPGLEQRILRQDLPPQSLSTLERLLNWLIPPAAASKQFLRPALAACLPLLMGIVVGNFYSFGYESVEDGFQYWEDELTMLSFNDYSETGPAQ